MNITQLLVPVGRRYVLNYKELPEQVQANLLRFIREDDDNNGNTEQPTESSALALIRPSDSNLTTHTESEKRVPGQELKLTARPIAQDKHSSGKARQSAKSPVAAIEFEVKTRGFLQFLQPKLRGRVNEATSELELTAELSKPVALILNMPVNLAVGAIFGTLISSYLVPDIGPWVSLAIAAEIIPMLLAVVAIFIVRGIFETKLPVLVNAVSNAVGAGQSGVTRQRSNKGWLQIVFSEQMIATIIAAVSTLGLAYYLHQYAWDLWCNGKYDKSEALCRPVQALAQAVLGSSSPVVADCNYYIAECLRCQGKYAEAERSYLEAIESLTKRLGEKNGKVVDGIFNLSRVYEAEGKVDAADQGYQKSVRLYEQAPDVGPDSAWLARVLDRQAMFYLKNKQLEKAEESESRATKIDSKWGSSGKYKDYAEALNDLGVIYLRQGRFQDAKQTLSQALRLKYTTDDDVACAVTEHNLAQVYRALGDTNRANFLADSARKKWVRHVSPEKKPADDIELYRTILDNSKQEYEPPHWESRSEDLAEGVGRI